jgi:dihydroorotate dehydrogenase
VLFNLIKPILFKLEPEVAHTVALKSLVWLARCHCIATPATNSAPASIMGLTFPNRVGLAAGLDKNGDYIDALAALGFGFIEVGTVTPKPQPGNPKPRLFRLAKASAIINRMGFNNKGVDYLVERLKTTRYQGILGINIGKNFNTPIEQAVEDYLFCLNKVYAKASYITVNISSPNTKNLRQLQYGETLTHLLTALKQQQAKLAEMHGKYVPLAIKIAPDLTDEEVRAMAESCLATKIDAIIATNTTLSRTSVMGLPFAEETGGLSGKPLFKRSTEVVTLLKQVLGNQIPIIAVGGIFSAADARAKLEAGADLVQVYTGFIYQGPTLIKELRSI